MSSFEERLLRAIANNKVLDVSRIRDDGAGVTIRSRSNRTRLIHLEDSGILSDNYDSYKKAIDMLGEKYQHLPVYFKIVQKMKEGDIVYIKYVMINNFPAFISDYPTYLYAKELLGPNYEYLDDYYNLGVGIREFDYDKVLDIIKNMDLRDHDNFAYNIAQQYGDDDYIDLFRDEIIKRDFIEQQALEKILGENSPYKDLHRYMKKL